MTTSAQPTKKRKRSEEALFSFSLSEPDMLLQAGKKLHEIKKTLNAMSEQLDPLKKEADILSKSILKFLDKEKQSHLRLEALGVELWVVEKDKKPAKNIDLVKEVLLDMYPNLDFDTMDQGIDEKQSQKISKARSLEVRERVEIMKSL